MDLYGGGSGLCVRYSPGVRLRGLRRTTRNFRPDSRQGFEPMSPAYKSTATSLVLR